MKKFINLTIFILVVITLNVPIKANSILNDTSLNIENISIRDFFEKFNYIIEWNEESKEVIIKNNEITIIFGENSKYQMKIIDNKAYISYEILGNVYKDDKNILFKKINNYIGNNLPLYYEFENENKNLKLLIFGATWCSFCKEQMDNLKQELINSENLIFEPLYISIDKDKEDINEYINEYNINILNDPEKVLLKSYNISNIPTLIFIKDKKIIYINDSILSFKEILDIFNQY